MAGTSELVRVLRELFDRTNRMRPRPPSTVVIIKSQQEKAANADRLLVDGTQPSATPKWAAAPTTSRANNNVQWTEGAQYR